MTVDDLESDIITEKHAPFEHISDRTSILLDFSLDAVDGHVSELQHRWLIILQQVLLREAMIIESLPGPMDLGVTQAEDVERRARLLALPEFGAKTMNLADYFGVADGNLIWRDTNSGTILLVQVLHVEPAGTLDIVPFQGETGDFGMEWSWDLSERRRIRAPEPLGYSQQ